MRARIVAPALLAALAVSTAWAHGPQLQITNDNSKIVTRHLILEEPYSASLTPATSVYVMPLREFNGAWYSRPNNTPSATIPGAPEYFSGPGLAYGYDAVDAGPQAFAEGSVLSIIFDDTFKRWNGSIFIDAGATQLKAFRGSNVDISSPPENFAITSNSSPFDGLSLSPLAANYNAGAHNTVRFALLGDGSSSTSASPDGVYLGRMQLSSTQDGLSPSDPYYFMLHKNAPMSHVVAAVQSLGLPPSAVQWVVPEPTTVLPFAVGLLGIISSRRDKRRDAKG